MRARFLAAFLVLDGLCAVALPALGAVISTPAAAASGQYVVVAGACVETMPMDAEAVGGRVVAMDLCGG